MRYRIGEVAEFFGMTKEGVRFLERQGIIRSERDERNGYRYFTRQEITRLKQIRSYQVLGFSLEEAADMVIRTRKEDLLDRIDGKLRELDEKEEQLRRMKSMLLGQRRAAQNALNRERGIELAMRPEFIFFPAVRGEAARTTVDEKEEIARARQAEKAWIQAMPPVMLGAIHCDAKGNVIHGLYGSVAEASMVHELGLPVLPCMMHLPGCLCVRGTVDAPQKEGVNIHPLLCWAHEHGYEPYGEVFAVIQATYCDEKGDTCRIREAYLPVREK